MGIRTVNRIYLSPKTTESQGAQIFSGKDIQAQLSADSITTVETLVEKLHSVIEGLKPTERIEATLIAGKTLDTVLEEDPFRRQLGNNPVMIQSYDLLIENEDLHHRISELEEQLQEHIDEHGDEWTDSHLEEYHHIRDEIRDLAAKHSENNHRLQFSAISATSAKTRKLLRDYRGSVVNLRTAISGYINGSLEKQRLSQVAEDLTTSLADISRQAAEPNPVPEWKKTKRAGNDEPVEKDTYYGDM